MQWYETNQGMNRLMLERDFLAKEYPHFAMNVEEEEGVVFAYGSLGPNNALLRRYQVLIALPDDYGTGSMPSAFVLEPEVKRDAPHRFLDGSLCVEHGDSFTPRSSIVTYLSWVMAWLILYEDWLDTGRPWD